MRLALLVSMLLLARCATGPVQPAMDYPPGAFYNHDGTPKKLPCLGGALLCPRRGLSRDSRDGLDDGGIVVAFVGAIHSPVDGPFPQGALGGRLQNLRAGLA